MKRLFKVGEGTLRRTAVVRLALRLTFLGLAPLFVGLALCPTRAAHAADAQGNTGQALEMLDKGELAAASGRFEEATRCWQKALELKPEWSKAQARLAELPSRQKRFPQEQADRERGVGARLAFVEGVQKFNEEDYQAAVDRFATCVEVHPQDQMAVRCLALARAMRRSMTLGSLQVDCRPGGQVFLDGKPQGPTPLTLRQVPIGRHEVAVEAYGARGMKVVEIKPRTMTGVALALYGGVIEVTSQPQAEIWLDGNRLGMSPFRMTGLPVGDFSLRAQCPGFHEKRLTVHLEKGTAVELDIKLSPMAKAK